MAVKHEIKSQLAKLLATEDLIVENKKVETAITKNIELLHLAYSGFS